MMRMETFHIHALPAELLLGVRASGTDDAGGAAEHVAADGGERLRCCLRNAEPSASVLLFNYVPPLPPNPYRESGAAYIHADAGGSREAQPVFPGIGRSAKATWCRPSGGTCSRSTRGRAHAGVARPRELFGSDRFVRR